MDLLLVLTPAVDGVGVLEGDAASAGMDVENTRSVAASDERTMMGVYSKFKAKLDRHDERVPAQTQPPKFEIGRAHV